MSMSSKAMTSLGPTLREPQGLDDDSASVSSKEMGSSLGEQSDMPRGQLQDMESDNLSVSSGNMSLLPPSP